MDANTRSFSGAALMLAIIPIIVGLLACLPVPVGDPERSRVDPDLNGLWALTADGDDNGYYLFRPWDKRTWLVLGVEDDGNEVKPAVVYKTWLAKLGGKTFMTWEMAAGMREDGSFQPEYWLVFRVEKTAANLIRLHPLDYDYEGFEDLAEPEGYKGNYVRDMRRKFERIIRKNVDDAEMYDDSLALRKLTGEELGEAADTIESYFSFE